MDNNEDLTTYNTSAASVAAFHDLHDEGVTGLSEALNLQGMVWASHDWQAAGRVRPVDPNHPSNFTQGTAVARLGADR